MPIQNDSALTPDQIDMYLVNVNIPFEVVNTVENSWNYNEGDSTSDNEYYSTYNESGYSQDNEYYSNSTNDNYNGYGSKNIVVRYVLPLDAAINTTIPMSKLIAVSALEQGSNSDEYSYQVSWSDDENNNYQYSNDTQVYANWYKNVERVPGTDWSQAVINNSTTTTETLTEGAPPVYCEPIYYDGPAIHSYPRYPCYPEYFPTVTELYSNTTTNNFTDQGVDYNITSTVTTTVSVVEQTYSSYGNNGTQTTTTTSITTDSVEFSKELATKYNDFSGDTPDIQIISANAVVFDVDLEVPEPLFEIVIP